MIKTSEKEIMKIRKQINKLNVDLEKLITAENESLQDKLKGDQFTAFIGEYYAAMILDADIEKDEKSNFDLIRKKDSIRIEVKSRTLSEKSDKNNSWRETSTISLNNISSDPKFICFVLLNHNDLSLNTIWLLDIVDLHKQKRINSNKKKTYLRINLDIDLQKMVYPYGLIDSQWVYNGTGNEKCIYEQKGNKKFQELTDSLRCS